MFLLPNIGKKRITLFYFKLYCVALKSLLPWRIKFLYSDLICHGTSGWLDCHRRRPWPTGAYFPLKTFLYTSFSWTGPYSRLVIPNIRGGTQNLRPVPLKIKELEPSKKNILFCACIFSKSKDNPRCPTLRHVQKYKFLRRQIKNIDAISPHGKLNLNLPREHNIPYFSLPWQIKSLYKT